MSLPLIEPVAPRSCRLRSRSNRVGPQDVRSIRPLLAEVVTELEDQSGFEAFDVTVLHPGRTLIEKLFAVAEIGDVLLADAQASVPSTKARHFYDIHALLGDGSPVWETLRSSADVTAIVRDCEEVSARWFGSSTIMTGSLADAGVFTDPSIRDRLAETFDETCSALCYPGASVPSWDEVCARVASSADRLRVEADPPIAPAR